MVKVVGVKFKELGKAYYVAPGEIEPKLGDAVIVETSRGLEYGIVSISVREVEDDEGLHPQGHARVGYHAQVLVIFQLRHDIGTGRRAVQKNRLTVGYVLRCALRNIALFPLVYLHSQIYRVLHVVIMHERTAVVALYKSLLLHEFKVATYRHFADVKLLGKIPHRNAILPLSNIKYLMLSFVKSHSPASCKMFD